MKGFPNQIADLGKLATSLQTVARLVNAKQNAKDDGVLGEALVRAGVLGTGHTPRPVEEYLREQRKNSPDRQSFRTSARGLRELFRLLGLIDDAGANVRVLPDGLHAANLAGRQIETDARAFWRRVILDLEHIGKDSRPSHPYQVLLRLVARKPGITRAKCALALEARDDSQQELDRISNLSDLREEEICSRLSLSKSNWDNAKKILPHFAEQLGDVVKVSGGYYLATTPGSGAATKTTRVPSTARRQRSALTEARTPRAVTINTIATAGVAERKEPPVETNVDASALAVATQARLERLRRHNQIVREITTHLIVEGTELYEDPFDFLIVDERTAVLGEVKTLDGTPQDERDRVREALSQLLYYEAFALSQLVSDRAVCKIACFEQAITEAHRIWLNESGIAVVWKIDSTYSGDDLAIQIIEGLVK